MEDKKTDANDGQLGSFSDDGPRQVFHALNGPTDVSVRRGGRDGEVMEGGKRSGLAFYRRAPAPEAESLREDYGPVTLSTTVSTTVAHRVYQKHASTDDMPMR